MSLFFYHLPKNFAKCFSLSNLPWHILAIFLTYIIMASGFDWLYFVFFHGTLIYSILFPAVIIGGLLPILAPAIMLFVGYARRNIKILNTAYALGQSAFIGLIISSLYKAFTGRIPPSFASTAVDISRGFQFGFLRGGIFWGWPSTHTTIAFAMSVTLLLLYPNNRKVAFFALLYAFYVGFGISMSIHWSSEFVAGAIIGSVIGVIVGKSFLEKDKRLNL